MQMYSFQMLAFCPRLTRRELLAVGGMALAGGCGRKVGAGFPGFALIATAGEKSISVVDLSSFRLTRQISLGESPSLVLGGKGKSYVLTPRSGSIHALEHENDFERVTISKTVRQSRRIKLHRRRQTPPRDCRFYPRVNRSGDNFASRDPKVETSG